MKLNNLEQIISYRKELHKVAEISGYEDNTSRRVKEFLLEYNPDKIIENIGGYGIAAIFGKSNKTKIMIRAELDALPIHEINEFEYKSQNENVSHKCGHDGHMAVLLACADYLSTHKINAQIILLFQPSEENGKGAEKVINDPKFKEIKPDYILSLHNLPGFRKNHILIKEGVFAAASIGMIINLKGKSTHAAHPENGISPTKAVTEILNKILELNNSHLYNDFSLATPIYTKLGEKAFGTAPHTAEIFITLRAFLDSDLERLINYSKEIVERESEKEKLSYEIFWDDSFSSTVNDASVVSKVIESCKDISAEYEILKLPFRWSEDFGVFTHKIKGAMFGIGSGENMPQLHNPDYDFPDEIIPTAAKLFIETIIKLSQK